MKEKKKVGGLKLMRLCFTFNDEHHISVSPQQQPKLKSPKFQQYQQFQQSLNQEFPHHLQLRRPTQNVQVPPRSPSQAGSKVRSLPGNQSRKSPQVEAFKRESPSSKKYELPCPMSPNIVYAPQDVNKLRLHPGHSNCDLFTFEELKIATKHFRPDLILGEGGFGVVYRGVIDEATRPGYKSREVAIKQLNRNGSQGDKEWLTEVSYLGQLSHPNLVNLIGYCCEDEHRLLVYEHMSSGCLEKHLFRRISSTLTWQRRVKILVDAARGLAYLHGLKQHLIYRDFKTANILLDSKFNATLSDFGLAKEGPVGDQTHVSTRVMGTYGYTAPEYIMTGHLTAMSDVYSFGVVLLEMLVGKRAFDKSRPSQKRDLAEWCRPHLNNSKKLLKLLDVRINGQFSLDEMMRVANLGYQCLSQNPKARPLMSHVVEILESVYEQEGQVGVGLANYAALRVTLDDTRSPRKIRNEREAEAAARRRRDRRCKSESQNDYTIFSPRGARTHSTTHTGC